MTSKPSEMGASSIQIARRFRGPIDSGNGGYVAGRLAQWLSSSCEAVEVTLHAPPPLDTPLEVQRTGEEVVVVHAGQRIAVAKPAELPLTAPQPVPLTVARQAHAGYAGFIKHPLADCFVCGPDRVGGDGLRVFPGPVEGRGLVATTFTADSSLADQQDEMRVATEFVWAVLDCPSFFALRKSVVALLGRMTARIQRAPRVGEECVVVGFAGEQTGRKHKAGAGLYSAAGELLAVAEHVWIELKAHSA